MQQWLQHEEPKWDTNGNASGSHGNPQGSVATRTHHHAKTQTQTLWDLLPRWPSSQVQEPNLPHETSPCSPIPLPHFPMGPSLQPFPSPFWHHLRSHHCKPRHSSGLSPFFFFLAVFKNHSMIRDNLKVKRVGRVSWIKNFGYMSHRDCLSATELPVSDKQSSRNMLQGFVKVLSFKIEKLCEVCQVKSVWDHG